MIQQIGKNRSRVWTMLSAVFLLLVCLETAWAAPLMVRVQPSGDSFAKAYVVTGEPRTYFGSVEGGTGPYQYKWEFTDGAGDTGFLSVGSPRYIAYDGKVFDSAGTKFARLTVRDSSEPQLTASATVNLQVLAAADDSLIRKKNSAVDRGLRYMYLQEQVSAQGSSWPGSGAPIGSTGMALIAMENHGHKLLSPDSDIYKKSVQEGIRYLLNNAVKIQLSDSACTGNPETDDGDDDNDGYGIYFNTSSMYEDPIALLALLNSTDKASAQSTVATSGAASGQTYWDIAVDAKDYLVYAQGEGTGGGANGVSLYLSQWPYYMDGYASGSDVTTLYGYVYSGNLATLGCGGTTTVTWGDGTTSQAAETGSYCPYWDGGYMMFGEAWGGQPLSHHYASPGTYLLSISYTDTAGHTVAYPSTVVTVAGSSSSCTGTFPNGRGGWRYTRNDSSADNSVTQWPVLALSEASNPVSGWGINVKPEVKDDLAGWLAYSQNGNGGFGYTSPTEWFNFPKTAAGTIMLKYIGKNASDSPMQNALSYLNGSWSLGGMDGNLGNLYSMYALYKGMKLWGMQELGGLQWEQIYTQQLVNSQQSGDYWYDGYWEDNNFATYSAIAILAPEVASLPPVANAGAPYPVVNPNQNVTLNGGSSYHQDSAKSLVKWEWDFNVSDGLWWDTKSAPAAGEGTVGMTATVAYPDAGSNATYTVTLRVSDNSTPTPLIDTDTASISVTSGNVPPVALTNGPWSALPGQPVIFDGSASYDPNACAPGSDPKCLNDAIVSYQWDLNGNGIFNEADDGTPVTPGDYRIVTKTFATPVSLPATLRVTDKHADIGNSSASFNIISIAIVYGQQYEICYKTALNRYQERQGIQVKFKNFGNSTANNLKMTLTQLPTNLTVSNNRSFSVLGTLGAGEEKLTACNPTAKTSDIELIFDRRIVPSNDWRWRGEFDVLNSHYTVDNIPPLAP